MIAYETKKPHRFDKAFMTGDICCSQCRGREI